MKKSYTADEVLGIVGTVIEMMTPPCSHKNHGSRIATEDGGLSYFKEVVCLDCEERLYAGRGGPAEDDPARGC
jgi:hypothetical protein